MIRAPQRRARIHKNNRFLGEKTMSKKDQKIEKKDAKTTKGAKAPELSEKELDKAAGGASTPAFLKATSRVTD